MDLKHYQLVLGSGSPRRKDLLTTAGLEFIVRKKDIEENYPSSLSIDQIAEYLAIKKAEVQTDLMNNDEILITADTIVAYQNKEYGKPNSRDDSIRMLNLLSNQEHLVYTGVCIKSKTKQKSFTAESTVKFGSISKEEAGWYYDNHDPSDKAGSYGIQDWLGRCKVEWIKGSYTNILGLPLSQTLDALQSFIHVNE